MKHLLLVLVLVSGAVSAEGEAVWATTFRWARVDVMPVTDYGDIQLTLISTTNLLFRSESDCLVATKFVFDDMKAQVEEGLVQYFEPLRACGIISEEKHKDRS